MLKVPRTAAYLVLVVLFATAIYMVYVADGISDLLPSGNLRTEQPSDDSTETIVDDDPVEWDVNNRDEYFIEYRLERERVRSKELDILMQMINNPNVTPSSKTEAEAKLLELQGIMELELQVEGAVKAQGFANAVLIMQQGGALVIVDAEELTSQQILLIAQITSQSTGLRASQVSISNQGGK